MATPLTFGRILIVEDDPRLAQTLLGALRDYATDVRWCTTLEKARICLTQWQPEVLLLDFKLPDGDAVELLKEAVQRPPYPTTIAISAYAQPNQTFELAQFGVRAYLQKPFTLSELKHAIQTSIEYTPNIVPHIRTAVGSIGLKRLRVSSASDDARRSLGPHRWQSAGSCEGVASLQTVSTAYQP